LQSQTNTLNVGLSSNWSVIPNSNATNHIFLPVDQANGSVFLRLADP